MNALEEVNRLKAERRRELAEAAREQQRKDEEESRAAEICWCRDVAKALAEGGCEFLLDFIDRAAEMPAYNWKSFELRNAVFAIPGHKPIGMRMHNLHVGNGPQTRWALAELRSLRPWIIKEHKFGEIDGWGEADTLADALLAAELPEPATDAPRECDLCGEPMVGEPGTVHARCAAMESHEPHREDR